MKLTYQLLTVPLLAAGMAGCSKMNDLHDKYLREGETIYVSRLDTVNLRAGNGRVVLRYVNNDPKVAKMIVYWRTRQDSAVLEVPPATGDTLEAVVPDLAEDGYNFELITMNKESKFRSVPYEINGNVYGSRFQASLYNRGVSSRELIDAENTLTVRWLRAPQYAVQTEIQYRDLDGIERLHKVPPSDAETVLTDVSGDVQYRTRFLPEPTAADTFSTAYEPLEPVVVEGVLLNKSLFKRWNPPGLPYTGNTTTAWRIENAWDGGITLGFANNNNQFTVDLGQTSRLSRLLINNRPESNLLYNHSHMRRFEIWGSATPDVTADFSGWVKLGAYESFKPSGASVGTLTEEDIRYAHTVGEKFYFPVTSPDVRYLRIVCQETWGKQAGIQFMEMTLTGVVK